jgi:hypothetical protein
MDSRPWTDTDLSLVLLGLMGWAAAGLFAFLPFLNTVKIEAPSSAGGKVEIRAVNPAAAGASCGFGVGGGLCFLGAALAAGRGRQTSRDESAAEAVRPRD